MIRFLLLFPFLHSFGQLWQHPLTYSLPQPWENMGEECTTISHSTAFEQAEGPVNFSTSAAEDLELPKILPVINATHWEQWEFDSLSDTGMAGMLVGFSRDASYSFFGQGNLRVEFYLTLSDGSIIQELDYLSESTMEDCGSFTRGTWKSPRRAYSFQVSKDMKHAKLSFNSPKVRGTFTITSVAPAHFADGALFPSNNPSSAELAPSLYFNQPIPGGRVQVDVTLASKKKMRFSGMGGHLRLWAKDSWFKICDGWHIVRAMVGPYTISYWEPVSRVNQGVHYYSAQLFEEGDMTVSTQVGTASATEDHVLFSDEVGGELSGRLADSNTGHILEFISPSRGRRWRFVVQHMKKEFEMGFGNGTGLTGFANRVVGGEVGGTQYEGRAFSEQVVLPKTIKQWQIWVVYGIGFLSRGKSLLMDLIPYFS